MTFSYRERIAGALLAYACGDALGLPWEGSAPEDVDMERVTTLPARPGWARGATSDDTALTLLVAEHLTEQGEARPRDEVGFLARLAERAPEIKGLGPSTTAAIDHFRETGRAPETGGGSNGAVMRALPVGWATPFDQVDRRRALTVDLSAATHPGKEAQSAACVASACAAWALEGASSRLLLEVAAEEAAAAVETTGADPRLVELIHAVAQGRWTPNPEGVTLDPYDTLAAALWCVAGAASLESALLAAIELGGDTDTVAALVGGLVGARMTVDDVRRALPWNVDAQLPSPETINGLAERLAAVRIG